LEKFYISKGGRVTLIKSTLTNLPYILFVSVPYPGECCCSH